jgi:hypothetical protein
MTDDWRDKDDHARLWATVYQFTQYRLELASGAAAAALSAYTLPVPSGVALLGAALLHPRTRETYRRAKVKRQWTRAVIKAGAADPPARRSRKRPSYVGPHPIRVRNVAVGDQLKVRSRNGVRVLDTASDTIAARLRVRGIRVQYDPDDASQATVTIIRRDPFKGKQERPWPNTDAKTLSLWDPIPIGVDEEGEPVTIRLVERNLLIGGEPGSGKSVALSLLAATGALDPNTHVWGMDGKRVELAAWQPCFEGLAGPNPNDAIQILNRLQQVMDRRYEDLLAKGQRKIQADDGLPLHLLLVDELAYYMQLPDQKAAQEIYALLRDIVARGRAAGIITIVATQKPSHDIIPTSLRDLFSFSLALRCNTPQASDTILGQGMASHGNANAATIPNNQRGVGYLLAEGEHPVRIKGYYLDDNDITNIASEPRRETVRAAARALRETAAQTETQNTDQELQALLNGTAPPPPPVPSPHTPQPPQGDASPIPPGGAVTTGLLAADLDVLRLLDRHGKTSRTRINQMVKDGGSRVPGLWQQGLIERHGTTGRGVGYTLTEQGREMLGETG